jgi:hypothetical protein
VEANAVKQRYVSEGSRLSFSFCGAKVFSFSLKPCSWEMESRMDCLVKEFLIFVSGSGFSNSQPFFVVFFVVFSVVLSVIENCGVPIHDLTKQ